MKPSLYILANVTSTAKSIPYAPKRFPSGAVLGLDNFLIPIMKSAADTRYPISQTTASTILSTPLLFALTSNHFQHPVGYHESTYAVDGSEN